MPNYAATINLPTFPLDPKTEQDAFIDALREQGGSEILVDIDAKSKRAAAKLLADSTHGTFSQTWDQYSENWWFDRLAVRRATRG